MPFEFSRELELEQNQPHDRGRAAGDANEIVDQHWRRSEQINDTRALFCAGLELMHFRLLGLFECRLERLAENRPQHAHHVGHLGHERRALLEQAVASFRTRIERRSRYREHLASLLEREAGGDQRP